eukprot:TRINITY_DN6317_c0_g1_i1.p1 TRINITY_DN6317_c0_g1~~TRINITY_DN6317_c0_g1_i1.p1  ORF type:complete len:695 (-),score=114.35 TRINITY_DN6317_c0_g1_i1:185-2269(-)
MALQTPTTASSTLLAKIPADALNLASTLNPCLRLNRPLFFLEKRQQKHVLTVAEASPETIASPRRRNVWVNPKLREGPPSLLPLDRRNSQSKSILDSLIHSLNSCPDSSQEAISAILSDQETSSFLSNPKNVGLLISRVEGWQKAYSVFQHFRSLQHQDGGIYLDLVVYNLTLKRLKLEKQWALAEEVMEQLVADGVKPDNYTFSALISCARLCDLPDKAVYWYERIKEFDRSPDTRIYSMMLDIYSRAGRVSEALALYKEMSSREITLDTIICGRLIRLFYFSGDYKMVMDTFYKMKGEGIKADVHSYNRILDAAGKISRPWQVRELQTDMIKEGVMFNRLTYVILIKAYSNFCQPNDAIEWFDKMKQAGHTMDTVLYNHLLGMFAELGDLDGALKLYSEMLEDEDCKPDMRTYSALINVYSHVGNASDAEKTLDEMVQVGFKPNIYNYCAIIQAYGRLNMFDDVVRIFKQTLEEDISPDFRFSGNLLSLLRHSEGEDVDKILGCIEQCDSVLASVVKKLIEKSTDTETIKGDVRNLLDTCHEQGRKPYCNLLIDICRKYNFIDRAHELMGLAQSLDIYKQPQTQSSREWTLNLKTLSSGAALTAVDNWFQDIYKFVEDGKELPPLITINTGLGRQKSFERSIALCVENHLKEIQAPFEKEPYKAGLMTTTRDALSSWLKSENFHSLKPQILL